MILKRFTIIIVLLFICTSCVREAEEWAVVYQIKNSSGFDITIRVFESFNELGNFEDVILLDEEIYNGKVVYIVDRNTLANTSDVILLATSYSSLRLIVVFNDERKTEHIRVDTDGDDIPDSFTEPINRHLLRAGNYTNIGNDIFEFVLTQEDYDNAIPCNEDCLD